jgi:hypothetical protein
MAKRATMAAITDAPLRVESVDARDRDSAETVEWALEARGTAPMPPEALAKEGWAVATEFDRVPAALLTACRPKTPSATNPTIAANLWS